MKQKMPYSVYLESEDNVILEISRNNGFSIYSIDQKGESKFLANSPIPYSSPNGVLEEPYFIDYINGDVVNKIHLLTSHFDPQTVIDQLKNLRSKISPGNYRAVDFSMEMSYSMAEYVELLSQLSLLTEEDEYLIRAKNGDSFFDRHFYKRTSELTPGDFEEIYNFFTKEIAFIESLKNN